jgi:Tol biopolymer transport system component
MPVTNGLWAFSLSCTPDGQWIVFTSRGADRWSTLWKVAVQGGLPKELNNRLVRSPVVSPDGKLIACFYVDENENTQTKQPSIALIPIEGGLPIKSFETSTTVNFQAGLQWSGDGANIRYVDNRNTFSNIWEQPIDGKPPKQLTEFKGEQIFGFGWSPGGSRLAFLRRLEKTYAVVLTNLN